MNASRSKKILGVGAIFAVVYISWCLHSFFMGAPLRLDPRISPEAASVIREVHSEKQFNRRGFSWSSFGIYLLHPSRAAHDKLNVTLIAPNEIALEVPGHKPWTFVTRDSAGNWVRADNDSKAIEPAEQVDAGKPDPAAS